MSGREIWNKLLWLSSPVSHLQQGYLQIHFSSNISDSLLSSIIVSLGLIVVLMEENVTLQPSKMPMVFIPGVGIQ